MRGEGELGRCGLKKVDRGTCSLDRRKLEVVYVKHYDYQGVWNTWIVEKRELILKWRNLFERVGFYFDLGV